MDPRIAALKTLDALSMEWAGTRACRVTRGIDLQPRLQWLQEVIKELKALNQEPSLLQLAQFHVAALAADDAARQAHSEARTRDLCSVREDEWRWCTLWEFIDPAKELASRMWYDAESGRKPCHA